MHIMAARPMRALSPAIPFAGKKNEPVKVLVAQGQGSVDRKPDTMTLSLTLKAEGETKTEVNQGLTDRAKTLMAAVTALPFPLVARPQLSVSDKTEYDQEKRQNRVVGAQGFYRLTLADKGGKPNVFAEHAAQMTEVAKKNDAEVGGPQFSLSPTQWRQAQRAADGIAYRDALASAHAVAKAGHFRIASEPLDVKVGAVGDYTPRGGGALRAMSSAAEAPGAPMANPEVSPEIFAFEPITVTSKPVRAVFQILPPAGKSDKK